jgi:hypothetical protein
MYLAVLTILVGWALLYRSRLLAAYAIVVAVNRWFPTRLK